MKNINDVIGKLDPRRRTKVTARANELIAKEQRSRRKKMQTNLKAR